MTALNKKNLYVVANDDVICEQPLGIVTMNNLVNEYTVTSIVSWG